MIDVSYGLKVKPRSTLLYWVLGILLGFFALRNLTAFKPRDDRPTFQYKLIETAVENKPLMNEIGGYNTHKFSYSASGLDRDSMHFELLIYGGSNVLTYTGWAAKTANKDWQIKRIDAIVRGY